MKAGGKFKVVLAAAGVSAAVFLLRSGGVEQRALEETRRALRQQGFKTDLGEFNFSTSEELRARAAPLTNLSLVLRPDPLEDLNLVRGANSAHVNLMTPAGANSARVIWLQEQAYSGKDPWPTLRETLNQGRVKVDAACAAVLSGPIRFDVNASAGNSMLLRHLSTFKLLARTLSERAVLGLYDRNKDGAWTNLLASTRLVTSWEPEPAEVSHLFRYACVIFAFGATWQAVQADGWADDRLATLQQEWESVDFFRGLPETAAFTRACMVAECQSERQQPLRGLVPTLKQALGPPPDVWSALTDYWRQLRYHQHGTYEDEKHLLVHYRNREQELRRAMKSSSWSEMRQLPGVTNLVRFQSKHPSRLQCVINLKQLSLASQIYAEGGQGEGLLGRAAVAEARRRLIVTAIALERYGRRHGSYPDTLEGLVPELLKNLPIDFMDGKPLRYRRTDDGHFVLYSVGLDCVDNGGKRPREAPGGSPSFYPLPVRLSNPNGTDLVWPRPATTADIERFKREQIKAQAERGEDDEAIQEEEQ
jgi:hypothetical protein